MIKLDRLQYEINVQPIENYILGAIYKQLPPIYGKTVEYNHRDVAKWYKENARLIKALNAVVKVIEKDDDFTITLK